MKLLIDANVILDVLAKREPHYKPSMLIWKLCETDQEEGIVSDLTFADLIYIMRKELDPNQLGSVWEKLKLIFQFADVNSADVDRAISMKWNDFEDALQYTVALRVQADYIITRNTRDYKDCVIPAITPTEYLLLKQIR